VTVAQLQDVFKLGSDHTLRGSFEYRHDTVNTSTVTGGNVFYDVVSSGAMWEWKILPSLTATNSVRFDDLMLGRDGSIIAGSPFTNASWNRNIGRLSFNTSLVWRRDDLNTFRLTASRGVQLPDLGDLGAIVDANIGYSGAPTLGPTTVTNWQAGWDRPIAALSANLHVSFYHQVTTAIVSESGQIIASPSATFIAPANIGDSRATGLDLKVTGKLTGDWRWSLGYSPEIITDHFEPKSSIPIGVDFQHTTPVHTVNASLGWSRGNWEADGSLRYESSIYGFTSRFLTGALTKIDNYVTLDGRLGYKATDRVTLSLTGQNLTQATQRQTSGPDVERRVIGSVGVDF